MLARLFAAVRFLLILAALPLAVVLYSTQAATAATYGSSVGYSFTQSGGGIAGSGGEIRCNGTAAYKVNDTLTMNVIGQIKCSVAIPISNDPGVGDLVGTTGVWFDGATGTGDVEGCDAGATLSGDPVAGISYDVGGFVPDCEISNVCVSYDWAWDVTMGPDIFYSGEWCGDLPMGPPPGVSESCPVGMPLRVEWQAIAGAPPFYGGYYGHTITVTFALGPDFGLWKDWAIEARKPTGGQGPVPDVSLAGIWKNVSRTNATNGNEWIGTATFRTEDEVGAGGNLYQPTPDPVGIWIWAIPKEGATNPDGSPAQAAPGVTRGHNSYTYGDNDPSGCHFYFGAKFRDDPNSDLDDPIGGLNSPEDVPTPGGSTTPPDTTPTDLPPPPADCDFDVTNPATWATAGICALVGLISRLIDVVGGLAAAILDGVKALFWPPGGLELRQRVQRMSDAFEGRFPFSIPGDVAGLAGGSMGSDGTFVPAASGGAGGSWGSNSCPDWSVDLPGSDADVNVVCDSSFTAAIRGARGVILAALLLLAFWPLIRSVFYASFPIIKPSPSSTSEK